MGFYTGGSNSSYIGSGVLEYETALTAATGTTAGGVLALANPFDFPVIITNAYINITTAATTATNTMDVGLAADGETSSDTLFDGQTTTAGLKTAGGTNGAVPRTWSTTQFITGTASATLVGMVANLHLVCIRQ